MKEKSVKTCLLLDFYGALLTEKMMRIMDLYYNEDFSLSEIAESEGISRQGVFDCVKRSEAQLEDFEKTLGLAKLHGQIEKATKLLEQNEPDKALEILKNV